MHEVSVKLACDLLELPRSSYYYRSRKTVNEKLSADIQAVAGKYPTYGSRRITHQLRRWPYDYPINRKRVQAIMRQLRLLRSQKRQKCRTTDSQHPYKRYPNLIEGLSITRPDQVWVSDITYIRLGQGFVYLAVILDVFTRSIRGWHLSRTLDQELSLQALRQALEQRCPGIHHSDQGVHYAAREYIDLLQSHHIQISMSGTGKPEENGFAERLMRTIKEEEVYLSEYRNFQDAFEQIGYFIEDVYMTKRIHSSLGYLTPVEFEQSWNLFQPVPDTP
jgi:transposase InsO family protein